MKLTNNKNKYKYFLEKIRLAVFLISYVIFTPSSVFAQGFGGGAPSAPPQNFREFVNVILGLVSRAIPFLIGLAFLLFLWGMALFILNAGNEEKIKDGKRLMLWGVIALFVMVSVWGIVGLLTGTFGFSFGFPQLKVGP